MTSLCQFGIASAVSTIYHPVAYAKTLIQIGYEPLPPYLTSTLLGNPTYMYPNVMKYIGHIYRTDGFFGLYRGLSCRLVSGIVGTVVTNSVQTSIIESLEAADELDEDIKEDEVMMLLKSTFYETISRCAGVLCSHPFYVIYVRSMAQFVGRETRFSSFFDSVIDISNNEGISGFFAGLIPRLVGEMFTIWIANVLTYAMNSIMNNISINLHFENYSVSKNSSLLPYLLASNTEKRLIASQITYPFTVVSVVMSVNSSKLVAASQPITASYDNWIVCWNHLSKTNQLKRGSSFFWRKYYGRQIVTTGGVMMPPLDVM
ncbi:hypothetical protein HELRODRAFT_83020 [Helobdella robusta]|uniref:Mitochondrial carrier homolog 2 n=1 Tax=Helobdella robusta TaxID=6412 RepID=T1G4Z2_HELRO|nr:hypothetical protein HELRODRAFT_83020 [Helobdella robusta]ESO00705.1 hypothetical protein HELRODRAFT_83020 [Helobdella robusta]